MNLRMRQPTMRDATALVGVAVATAIATRLLPPLMAQAVGTARGAAGRDPFDALAADHRHIHALLTEMEKQGSPVTRGACLLRVKHRLAAHAMAEENILYPLLHDRMGEVEPAKRLYDDHAEIKIHLHALEEMDKDDSRWVARARQLRTLVEEHVRQEEEVEFPKLRSQMSDKGRSQLLGHLQREKAMLL